jgi:hypothetical protein
MLASTKPGADFGRGCAHPDTRPLISTTRPPHNSRILIPANAIRTKGNGADNVLSAPVAQVCEATP